MTVEQALNPSLARPINILLVEDSPSDAAMTVTALKVGHIANRVHVVTDGEQAMDCLHQVGDHGTCPRPDLVILDLNLPRKDGREVLTEVKGDPGLKTIPVVVLTTSAADADILRTYELHGNSYVTKPVGLDAFLEAVGKIEDFWLQVVRLPVSHDR